MTLDFEYGPATEAFNSMLFDSETVVATISGQDGNKKMRSRYVLTDKRLLRWEDNVAGDESDVYRLSNITSVDFDSGLLKNKVTIRGSGIDEEFSVGGDNVEAFVNALREATL